MWILEGPLLGLWLLGFGTALLYFAVYRNMLPNSAVGRSVIAHIRHDERELIVVANCKASAEELPWRDGRCWPRPM